MVEAVIALVTIGSSAATGQQNASITKTSTGERNDGMARPILLWAF